MVVDHGQRVASAQQGVDDAAVEVASVVDRTGVQDGVARVAGEVVAALAHAADVLVGVGGEHPVDVRLLEPSASDVLLQAEDVGARVAEVSQDQVGVVGRVRMVGVEAHDVVGQELDGALGSVRPSEVQRTVRPDGGQAAEQTRQRHERITVVHHQPEQQKQHRPQEEHREGESRTRLHRVTHRVDVRAVGTEQQSADPQQVRGEQYPSQQASDVFHWFRGLWRCTVRAAVG